MPWKPKNLNQFRLVSSRGLNSNNIFNIHCDYTCETCRQSVLHHHRRHRMDRTQRRNRNLPFWTVLWSGWLSGRHPDNAGFLQGPMICFALIWIPRGPRSGFWLKFTAGTAGISPGDHVDRANMGKIAGPDLHALGKLHGVVLVVRKT
jgi:hypothetical protein